MEKAQQNKHFQHGIWSNIIRPVWKYKRTTISTKFHAYNSSHQTVAQQKHKKKKHPSSNSITKCEPLPIKKIKKKKYRSQSKLFPRLQSQFFHSQLGKPQNSTQKKKRRKSAIQKPAAPAAAKRERIWCEAEKSPWRARSGHMGARRERRRRGQEEEDAPTSQTPRPHLLLCTELKRWAAMAVGFLGAEIGGSGRDGAHGDGSPLSPHPCLYPFSECICIYLLLVPGLEQSCDTRPPVIGSEAVP